MAPMCSPWNCLYSSKKSFCWNTVSVGRLRAQASAYFVGLGLELVARDDLVEEVAVVHLGRGERTPGEDHLLELPQAHRLHPGPHARAPALIAERGVAEQRVVGRDHQVGVAGLVEVPPVAVALDLDDADLLELLQAPAAAARWLATTG